MRKEETLRSSCSVIITHAEAAEGEHLNRYQLLCSTALFSRGS